MDLDEMLHVNRCRDMDELINFWARSGLQMPEPDCLLHYRVSHATQNFMSEKYDVYVLVAAARRGFKMVLWPSAAVMRGFTMVSFIEAVFFFFSYACHLP